MVTKAGKGPQHAPSAILARLQIQAIYRESIGNRIFHFFAWRRPAGAPRRRSTGLNSDCRFSHLPGPHPALATQPLLRDRGVNGRGIAFAFHCAAAGGARITAPIENISLSRFVLFGGPSALPERSSGWSDARHRRKKPQKNTGDLQGAIERKYRINH